MDKFEIFFGYVWYFEDNLEISRSRTEDILRIKDTKGILFEGTKRTLWEYILGVSKNQNYSRLVIMLSHWSSKTPTSIILDLYFAFSVFSLFQFFLHLINGAGGIWRENFSVGADDWFENKTFQQLKLHFFVTRTHILDYHTFNQQGQICIPLNHIWCVSIEMKIAAYKIKD